MSTPMLRLLSPAQELTRAHVARIAELEAENAALAAEIVRLKRKKDLRTHGIVTDQQIEVLKLIACGLDNNQIADQLILSERTIRTHVSGALLRLNLANRTQLAVYALSTGLLTQDDAWAAVVRLEGLDP